jgi:hypothetical protein
MPNYFISSKGVKSFRSSRYSTYSALAELIDNSIQAKANNILLIGIQEKVPNSKRSHLKEIIIYDNGIGMSKEVANIALQLGGGIRHGATTGLGKYGMGLPQSSSSQAPRTELYSWQNENEIEFVYLDFDELEKEECQLVDPTTLNKLPNNISLPIVKAIEKLGLSDFSKQQGTIVRWQNCDQLSHLTYNKFFEKIEEKLGQIYRHDLVSNSLTMSVVGFNKTGKEKVILIEDNFCSQVRPYDPMFCMKNSCIERINPTYKESPPSDLQFEISEIKIIDPTDDTEHVFDIQIRFSLINKESYSALFAGNPKSRPGETTELGKAMGSKIGISLLRAGRELKFDGFGYIDKNPEERWWSCEVDFKPEYDDLFGVSFDKQDAKNFRNIEESLDDDAIDTRSELGLRLLKEISNQISGNLKGLRKKRTELAEEIINEIKKTNTGGEPSDPLPDLIPESECPIHNIPLKNNKCEKCIKIISVIPEAEELRLRKELRNKFPQVYENESCKEMNHAIKSLKESGKKIIPIYVNSSETTFFEWDVFGDIIILELNKSHNFFKKYLQHFIDDDEKDVNEILPVKLLIYSFIMAQKEMPQISDELEDMNSIMGTSLRRIMRNFAIDTK